MEKQSLLILVRHGKSEWNTLGLWTGWQNPDLHEVGREEAHKAAASIKDVSVDVFIQSDLNRVKQTVEIIKSELGREDAPTLTTPALRERSYGVYEGKNKWQIKEEVGEEEFQNIRRGWEHPIPNGETLRDVYNRVVPYFTEEIAPLLKEGKNVLVGASGNSLRALVKYLENIADDKISELEIGTGEVYIYSFTENMDIKSKEVRSANELKGKV